MSKRNHERHSFRAPGRPVDSTLGPMIVNAVLDLLAETGYARLTLNAVASRAGVSTATVHRRWSTKRELILAVASQIAAAEMPFANTGSLEGDLQQLFEQKRRVFSGKIGAALVSLVGESAHDSVLASVVRESILDPTRDHLRSILGRETDRRQIADIDAAARLIVGLIVTNAALSVDADNARATIDVLPAADVALVIQAIRSMTTAPE